MPIVDENEPIYPGTAFTWRLPAVRMDDELLTAADPPTSFTYAVLDSNGSTMLSGSMTHSTRVKGTWEARIAPAPAAGTYHLHGTVIKTPGGTPGKFHDTVVVTPFT